MTSPEPAILRLVTGFCIRQTEWFQPLSATTTPIHGSVNRLLFGHLWQRLLAWIIDLFMFYLFLALLAQIGRAIAGTDWVRRYEYDMIDGGSAANVWLLMLILIWFASFNAWGLTPGKCLVGLRIVDRVGQRPGVRRSLLRLWGLTIAALLCAVTYGLQRNGDRYDNGTLVEVLQVIALLALPAWLIGSLCVVVTRNNQSAGDLLSGTYVVRTSRNHR